jgi:hypothetical protein
MGLYFGNPLPFPTLFSFTRVGSNGGNMIRREIRKKLREKSPLLPPESQMKPHGLNPNFQCAKSELQHCLTQVVYLYVFDFTHKNHSSIISHTRIQYSRPYMKFNITVLQTNSPTNNIQDKSKKQILQLE